MIELSDVFAFDNTFERDLEGLFVPWKGAVVPDPRVVQFNQALATELGLDPQLLLSTDGAQVLVGSVTPEGASPMAQAYAGHQFGGFSPQLGDGRALLVGELVDRNGMRRDLQLKGSGQTPFSRRGDGKAVLGPVLREYLMGEAMHALGVPTTRALAAVTTGEQIRREGLEPGAVLVRVAASHLRVGTFQFVAVRGDNDKLKQLADYTIRRHFPELLDSGAPYLDLLRSVRDSQASLVAQWLSVGFVHGVMNTDNVAISGETLDYGPCAFLDDYDSAAVFSSIDRQGRYAYGNQPAIAQWNLARFAETLLPLIDPEDPERAIPDVTQEVEVFGQVHNRIWVSLISSKIGLGAKEETDAALVRDLFPAMQGKHVDFTQFFRRAATWLRTESTDIPAWVGNAQDLALWLPRWRTRLEELGAAGKRTADEMDAVNPIYIPRNHKVEEALAAASGANDYHPFERLLEVVSSPFEARAGLEEFAEPAPAEFGPYVTFCGT